MRSTSALTNRESPESRDRPGPSALLLSRGSPPPSLFISSRLFTSATFPSDFDSVLLLPFALLLRVRLSTCSIYVG
jgi:hypothetical protein